MNIFILIGLYLILFQTCFSQKQKFEIVGVVDRLRENEKVFLKKRNWIDWKYATIDSTISKNGYFRFEGENREIEEAEITAENKSFAVKFVLVDTTISIVVRDSSFILEGGRENEVYANKKVIEESILDFSYLSGDSSDLYRDKNQILYNTYKKLAIKIQREVLDNAMDSLFRLNGGYTSFSSLYYLYSRRFFLNHEAIRKRFNTVQAPLIQHQLARDLDLYLAGDTLTHIKKIEHQKDTLGRPFVYDFPRAGYVLLDYWASWCGYCRENNGTLKELYKKYSPKQFDIVAISVDSSKKTWLEAVKEDNLPWNSVSQLKGVRNYMALKTQSDFIYPTYILLNSDGKIIKKMNYINEVEDLLKKIYGY